MRQHAMTYWFDAAASDRLLKVEHRVATCEEAITAMRVTEIQTTQEPIQPPELTIAEGWRIRLQHEVDDLEELKLITDAYVVQLEQEAIRLKASVDEQQELLNKAHHQHKAHWELLTQMAHDIERIVR